MEPYLGTPAGTRAVLKKYGISTQKKYGQNFLVDPSILEATVAAAGLTKEDFVVEIGPGIGTLTQYLAANARKVVAVEIDRSLQPVLADTLAGFPNAEVRFGDVLKIDLASICQTENGGWPVKVVANLPYYITTPILMGLFESGLPLLSITVMVQKEVADRMVASPGTKDYGALSLAVQYRAKPEIACIAPAAAFLPPPKVDSAVVHLPCYEKPPVDTENPELLFQLVHAAFGQRRKTLANALAGDSRLGLSKDRAAAAIEAADLPANVRGERLSLEDFARLAQYCHSSE